MRAFFSAETLAQVQALPRGDKAVFCPRGKQEIAAPCQEALALLLLRTCGVVRMARAVLENLGAGMVARFEVLFSDTPCGPDLSHAFSALSVGCRIAGRE